jgi:hypothetical protein
MEDLHYLIKKLTIRLQLSTLSDIDVKTDAYISESEKSLETKPYICTKMIFKDIKIT